MQEEQGELNDGDVRVYEVNSTGARNMEFNATFIVSAISFIVFTLIMNAIFYKPLQNIVHERQNFIDETNEEAKLHRENAQVILKDREQKLEKTKHSAKKIITDSTDEVKARKQHLASEAQKKAVQKIGFAKEDLQKSKDEAQAALSEEVKNIAQKIASKILGQT